jgi:hypothetical protein
VFLIFVLKLKFPSIHLLFFSVTWQRMRHLHDSSTRDDRQSHTGCAAKGDQVRVPGSPIFAAICNDWHYSISSDGLRYSSTPCSTVERHVDQQVIICAPCCFCSMLSCLSCSSSAVASDPPHKTVASQTEGIVTVDLPSSSSIGSSALSQSKNASTSTREISQQKTFPSSVSIQRQRDRSVTSIPREAAKAPSVVTLPSGPSLTQFPSSFSIKSSCIASNNNLPGSRPPRYPPLLPVALRLLHCLAGLVLASLLQLLSLLQFSGTEYS